MVDRENRDKLVIEIEKFLNEETVQLFYLSFPETNKTLNLKKLGANS